MKARVLKWGDDIALRIPRPLAAEANLNQGTLIEMAVIDGKLVIAPTLEPELTLDAVLAKITTGNLHAEVRSGPAVGNETW